MQTASPRKGYRPATGILRMVLALLALPAALALGLGLAAGAAAAQGYRLQSGDVLRIEVLEDSSLNRTLLVAPDGKVSLPMAGSVTAGGRTVEQIQDDLATRLAPNFAARPTVFVSLDRLAEPRGGAQAAKTINVYVMGEAAKPGQIAVAPKTTVLQTFSQMGGFTKFAARKRIQLRRDGKTYGLNYADIESGRSNAGNMQVQDGDVIVIPQRKLFE